MANVFTIPSSAPFAQTIADELLRRLDAKADPLALSRATIFVPTRRAVRSLGEIFARAVGGAVLLPDIRPLGDVDEDDVLFDAAAEDIELVPAISPVRRRLLLATMIARWQHAKNGEEIGFAQATRLARSLGAFLDEAQTQGVDLSKLRDLVPSGLSAYWSDVYAFLDLLVTHWPAVLADENRQDHVTHRDGALRRLAMRLERHPPDGPVIAAGSTGSIPATAELLGVVSRLKDGAVVLPGLDLSLDDASWNDLDEGHPQFGMRELLRRIGVQRKDVRVWGNADAAPSPREILLRETLRPAPTTDAWRALAESGREVIEKGLDGLSLVEADDPAQEATAIALMLREVLEENDRTGALVTPDRSLARRVAAELKRWNIDIDDSAGRPLARTAPGAFLCLLADAALQKFAPVPLLALLKHPLASGGEETASFRRSVRQLDLCLRGPRPDEGLAGIAKAVEREDKKKGTRLSERFEKIAQILAPFGKAMDSKSALSKLLSRHVEAAEALAATDKEGGGERLWRGDAGRGAQNLIAELYAEAGSIPEIDGASYAPLFRMLTEEKAVRPPFGRHPRLQILGPLEARLQRFDLVVLGGLNEGTWPQDAPVDPWLSRPMRRALGLEQPERAIGLAAHDFATLAAGPRVILTRSRKVDGSPAVASRWLQRMIQLTRGLGFKEQLYCGTGYRAIAAALDEPPPSPRTKRPEPKPPVAARPRKLSVTEIETWLRDPYAIYARRILKLEPLDPLDEEIGARDRGTAIHKVLEEFVKAFPGGPPPGAERTLVEIADRVFSEYGIPKAVIALWRPRFIKAANWFAGIERQRRTNVIKAHVEVKGEIKFAAPGGEFTLYGKADRIDELASKEAAIIDYKTGKPPTDNQVKQMIAPQLPLEAAMVMEGGFAEAGTLDPAELVYVWFSGGAEPGEIRAVKANARELASYAKKLLGARIEQFDCVEQAYLPRVKPYRADEAGDYDHLARVQEWSVTGWGEEE